MVQALSWQQDGQVLSLRGELTSVTLLPLWKQLHDVVSGVSVVDVGALTRVDTAGLALLIHLTGEAKEQGERIALRGMSDKLVTLAALYNLPENLLPRSRA